jgi:energy-coupling factor transport system ATP-binding protein
MVIQPNCTDSIVSIKNVNFTYLGEESPALKDINLEVKHGEFVLIVGPSGSGKTSLVNLLNGTIPSIFEGDLSGEVIVDGLSTSENSIIKLSTIVGQVFQDPDSQIVNVFVKDEIYFGPENLNVPIETILKNSNEAISLVGIEDLVDRDIFLLSGGQKQKVALTSVLSMKPKILVLDQPTANLDPHSTREVFKLVGRLNKELGMTVFVIEHNVDDLIHLVTKVVVMDKGTIAAAGTPRDVFGRSFLESSKSLGLWVPQVTELALQIGDRVNFKELPLTVLEAYPEISKLCECIKSTKTESSFAKRFQVNSTEPQIEIKHLNFNYKVNNFQALDDVNITIKKGEFISIIGKNGSGKSTLAKILTKINDAPPASVYIYGKDISAMGLFETTKIIGYVFQNPDHQFIADTVFDEVAYSLRARNVDEEIVKQKVMDVLTRFGLEKYIDLSPFALSMGYRRLLSVTTMLVVDQDVIILDEPTIGQDQVSCDLLMGYLKQLNDEGKTIILITHDMRLISEWVGRVIIMSDSHLLFDGPIYETFRRDELLEKAAINVPPIVELVKQLRKNNPLISDEIMTVEHFCELLDANVPVAEAI